MGRKPYTKFHGTHSVTRKMQAKEPRPAGEEHGLYTLRRTVDRLGLRGLDGRSKLAKALGKWRAEVVSDLGGEDVLSAQLLAIVDLACRTKLLLDSIDAYLLELDSLVNKRRRSVYPVVRERQVLADALARYLGQLGLERRARPVLSPREYLEARVTANGEDR